MEYDKLIKAYIPMTETAYYILLSLNEPRHGYGIIRFVDELTHGRIVLGSGTIYGTLIKMQKDKLISVFADGDRKTVYEITTQGLVILVIEMERVKILHADTLIQEGRFNDSKDFQAVLELRRSQNRKLVESDERKGAPAFEGEF